MRWLRRPEAWFLLAVALTTAGGAAALNTRTCKALGERDWQAYGTLNAWHAAFDALSATCGAGLLTADLDDDYTVTGRWVLTALGLLGAILYLVAARQALGRLCGDDIRSPPVWAILAVFALLTALSVPIVGGLEWLVCDPPIDDGWTGSAWRAISAFASLGWLPGSPSPSAAWIYALVALAGGMGWMAWLLPLRAWRVRPWRILALVGTYVAFLALVAILIFALEAPRGARGGISPNDTLTGQTAAFRYSRALTQTICASATGLPTEDLAERGVIDGTKAVLAGVLLVGPLAGAAGGGITWTLIIWGLISGAISGLRRRSPAPVASRFFKAGAACLVVMVGLTLVTALGLLIIEAHTASAYQTRPTFADSLLDASSAVAGGNLSSGVIRAVTHRNLSSGIRRGVDSYQYGVVWLMAAMLLGRVLPLLVLSRAATTQRPDASDATPPLT